jgi:hypothetical protein
MEAASDDVARLDAFLRAQALPQAVPAVLAAEGEALYLRLAAAPPPDPRWGRFLVALGAHYADGIADRDGASRCFLRAVSDYPRHGDAEAAATAGYNQGVLFERAGRAPHALAAYRASAELALTHGPVRPTALLAATALARLEMERDGELGAPARGLLKQAWLSWLALRRSDPRAIDDALARELGRCLCALLLPEDDPARLAEDWRAWPPARCAALGAAPADGDPEILAELFRAAAEAAAMHLADEGPDPGMPYRLLLESLLRSTQPHEDPRTGV